MTETSFWNEDTADEIDQADKRGKRNYVGTKNNYTDEDITKLEEFAKLKCTYLVYGKEIGSVEKTPHLQIYMEFQNTISMKSIVKKLFPMWLGYRKGTPRQAAGYCKKGEDLVPPTESGYDYFFPRSEENPGEPAGIFGAPWDGKEFGEISRQGKRTDIDELVEMIVHENRTIRDTALEHPAQFVKYHKGLRDLRALVLPPRSLTKAPEVIVLWGKTDTGKTRDAYTKYWPEIPHYVWRPSNGNWWDGYDGEDKIIIDEFRGTMVWSDLLGLLDRNEFRAQYKGGFVNIQASKFIITSPFPPHTWYKEDDRYDRYAQLARRITSIVEYKGPLSGMQNSVVSGSLLPLTSV